MSGLSILRAITLRRRAAWAAVLLVALCATALNAGMPRAQKHESRHEIDQLEELWRNAILKADFAAMDALLADDYIAITPSGTLQTKEQALTSLRSGGTRIASIEFSDRKVRFYGTTALVTSRAEVIGSNAAGEISGSYRYTRVYVRDQHGSWKIVSFEASWIRDAGEHR
jgi:ketosteroid isomerase-like protein